jgi:hypothetical protein
MRSGWTTAHDLATRACDPTARIATLARLETLAALKQSRDQWLAADTPLSTDLEITTDGGVRLKNTLPAGPADTVTDAYLLDKAHVGAPPASSFDPPTFDGYSRIGALISWASSDSADLTIHLVEAWLHPRNDPAAPRTVLKWWCAPMAVVQYIIPDITDADGFSIGFGQAYYQLEPLAPPVSIDAVGDAAGWVAFPFPDGFQPKQIIPTFDQAPGTPVNTNEPRTILLFWGTAVADTAAVNVGWGYHNVAHTVSGTGADLYGRILSFPKYVYRAMSQANDGGTWGKTPNVRLSSSGYVNGVISFTDVGSTNHLDLLAVPTAPLELVAEGQVPPGTSILYEISDAVNALADPEAFGSANWSLFHASVGANADTAPNGTVTADKLKEDATNNAHDLFPTVGITIAAGEQFAVSVSARAAERTKVRLSGRNGADGFDANFDLSNGTLISSAAAGTGTLGGASIEVDPRRPGYYRLKAYGKINAAGTVAFLLAWLLDGTGASTYLGDGVSGAYFWGAQLERNATGAKNYFETFVDRQLSSALAPAPLALQQTYRLRFQLTANGVSDTTPTLRRAGARQIAETDITDLSQVRSVDWLVDPITHRGKISQLTLSVLKDGERDFHDALTELLSQNPIGRLTFRLALSAPGAPLMILDDYLVEDALGQAATHEITGVSVLSLMRGELPLMSSEVSTSPGSDVSNPGVWTIVGTGTTLWTQLRDLGGPPDDTTGVKSPVNPVTKEFTVALDAIGTPLLPDGSAQLTGIVVQVRYNGDGVNALPVTVSLLEGATTRATFPVITAQAAAYGQKAFFLMPTQITSIGSWANLRLKFSANGTGQATISWARLVVLGIRSALSYANQPVGQIATDLFSVQLGIPDHYRGPSIVDTTPPLTASKTIVAVGAGGSTDLTKGKQELDWLAFIAGLAWISSQGRIKAVPFYDLAFDGAGNPAFRPHIGPVVARFPIEEIDPVYIGPGFRQRLVEWWLAWGYKPGTNIYQGESHGEAVLALENLGPAMIDPVKRAEAGLSQWVNAQSIADALTARTVTAFGLGLMAWRFRTTYAHPFLEPGDIVTIETDRFVAYDPTTVPARAIAGPVIALGMIVGVYDVWGRDLEVWIPNYSQIVVGSPQAHVINQPPPDDEADAVFDVVLNGGFESDLLNWSTPAAGFAGYISDGLDPVIDLVAPFKGLKTLKLTHDPGAGTLQKVFVQMTDDGIRAVPVKTRVRPSEALRVLFTQKADSIGLDMGFGIVEWDDQKNYLRANAFIYNAVAYTSREGVLSVGADCYFVTPVLYLNGAAGTIRHGWFDELHVFRSGNV